MKIPSLLAAAGLVPALAMAQAPAAPPNAPATVERRNSSVVLTYQGRTLFEGTLVATGGAAAFSRLTDSAGGRVTQVLKWTAAGRGQVTLTGQVHGSPEAFAAEAEPREDGLRVVRHQVGPASNGLNRAVYDRRADWVLSVDEPARVALVPAVGADSAIAVQLVASGG
jgi:hypothetical protein